MKDILVDCLHGVDIRPDRRCGNTTRVVDNIIDLLFQGFKVNVRDHKETGIAPKARMYSLVVSILKEHSYSGDVKDWVVAEQRDSDLIMYLKK